MARFDLGGAASGALSGGTFGGSIFGAPGAAAGALIGGIGGGIFGGPRGGHKPKRLSTFDPQQQNLYNQQYQGLQGQGPFSDLYSWDPNQVQDLYQKQFAQPAYQDFEQNIIPQIAGQFRGQNLQDSSYFGGALGRAGADVQNNIQAQLANLLYGSRNATMDRRQNAIDRLLGQSTFAYDTSESGPRDNPLDKILGSLSEHAGRYLANKYLPIK